MSLWQCWRPAILRSKNVLRQHPKWTSRALTSASDSVILDMDSSKGVATLKFNKPPVNSMNLEFIQDMVNTIDVLEKDKACRGVILTSNKPGIFSAGLDIMEMYQPNLDRLYTFWSIFQELWIRLYGSKLIFMSAINGHSPAGGCMMALSCDYRVMAAGKYTIGLNESLLGIVAPIWLQMTMKNTVGHRETERALELGLMYHGEEALQVGLIDQLVTEEQVMVVTQAEMDKWLQIPDVARQTSKLQMRKQTLDYLIQRQKEEVDKFVNFVTKDSIQKSLGLYLESLKKKKSVK